MRHDDDSPTHRAAGPAAPAADRPRIEPLSRVSDFKVAAGDPDVHGFRVLAQDGQPVGEIDEVLVDVEAGVVRYLDVELDADLLASGGHLAGRVHPAGEIRKPASGIRVPEGRAPLDNPVTGPVAGERLGDGPSLPDQARTSNEVFSEELDRHVLVPIGYARLPENAETEDVVILPGLEAAMVVGLPDYEHGPVTREVEVALLRYLDPGFGPREEEGFYDNDAFDEDAFYGARRGESSAAADRPLTEQDDRPVNEDRGVHPAEERRRAQLEEEATAPTRGRY